MPPLQLSSGIIQFYDIEEKNYIKNPEGAWLFAIRLAEKFYEQGEKKLENCTNLFYDMLLQENTPYLLPIVATQEQKTSLLEKRVQESYFQKYRLTEREAEETQKIGKDIVRAEYYYLYAELTIAEIKQTLSQAIARKKFSSKYRIKPIEALPEIAKIAKERARAEILKTLYKQLMITNHQLSILSWETIYDEDRKNNIISMKQE